MQVLVAPRRAGKTHRAVVWVNAGSPHHLYPFWTRIILTVNEREADRLRKDFGLDYRQVFSIREFREGRFPNPDLETLVDDLDLIVSDLLRIRPTVATITGVPL